MAKFNKVDAPNVGSLVARTAATPYPAAPSTVPSGPAPNLLAPGSAIANYDPARHASVGGFGGIGGMTHAYRMNAARQAATTTPKKSR